MTTRRSIKKTKASSRKPRTGSSKTIQKHTLDKTTDRNSNRRGNRKTNARKSNANKTRNSIKEKKSHHVARKQSRSSEYRKTNNSRRKLSSRSRASRYKMSDLPILVPSVRYSGVNRRRVKMANMSMSATELQMMAKSLGIPFGGLAKHVLVNKINRYK